MATWKENHNVNTGHTLQGFHSALMVENGPQKRRLDPFLGMGWMD
ncbi:MAG: hypothetical protein AAFR66_23955 [Bacteroidota bacterium]